MPFDESPCAEIELIVLGDDRVYLSALLSSLDAARHRYTITEIAARDSMVSEFEAAIEVARGKRPAIVFLDCEFLQGQTEMLAARVLELRRGMAIECVIVRPPSDHHRRVHLLMLGASLFDGHVQTAEIVRLQ